MSLINNKLKDSKTFALIVKVVIITVGVFITLYQLGIAKGIVNAAFIIVLGSFAVAFGIGGRDFAKSMLGKLEKKIDKKK